MYPYINEKKHGTLSLKLALLEHLGFTFCFKHFAITDIDDFRKKELCTLFFLFGYLRAYCFPFSHSEPLCSLTICRGEARRDIPVFIQCSLHQAANKCVLLLFP